MSTRKGIVTYALVGLAIGTVTWLLVGTKEGRKQLDCANDGIRKLTKSIKSKTKEGADKVSQFAEKAGKEIRSFTSKAKGYGEDYLDEAEEATKSALKKAERGVKAANKEIQKA